MLKDTNQTNDLALDRIICLTRVAGLKTERQNELLEMRLIVTTSLTSFTFQGPDKTKDYYFQVTPVYEDREQGREEYIPLNVVIDEGGFKLYWHSSQFPVSGYDVKMLALDNEKLVTDSDNYCFYSCEIT